MPAKVKTVKKQQIRNPKLIIAIPIRDRWGARVRNCIRSIKLQTIKSIEVVVADYGSIPKNHEKLMKTLEQFNCTVYHFPTEEVWSLSISRNIGIRRSEAKVAYVATLDVDCILEPKVVSTILDLHKKHPRRFIASRLCHLPKMKLEKISLPRDYDKLNRLRSSRRSGYGGLMSAPREWWFKVRGFDERMKAWGAEDNDMRKRAQKDGMKMLRLEKFKRPGTQVFHQWHPPSVEAYKKSLGKTEYMRLYNINCRIFKSDKSIIRNDKAWGAFV